MPLARAVAPPVTPSPALPPALPTAYDSVTIAGRKRRPIRYVATTGSAGHWTASVFSSSGGREEKGRKGGPCASVWGRVWGRGQCPHLTPTRPALPRHPRTQTSLEHTVVLAICGDRGVVGSGHAVVRVAINIAWDSRELGTGGGGGGRGSLDRQKPLPAMSGGDAGAGVLTVPGLPRPTAHLPSPSMPSLPMYVAYSLWWMVC